MINKSLCPGNRVRYKGSIWQCIVDPKTYNDDSSYWYVDDCGGGTDDNYRIKVTDYNNADCYNYSSYFKIDAGPWTVSCPVVADAYISEYVPDRNFGWSPSLILGNDVYDNAHMLFYLRFDISDIPDGATIQSAVLQLHMRASPPTGLAIIMETRMVYDSWNENTITWNNPAYGWGAGPIIHTILSGNASGVDYSINVIAHVRNWVDNVRPNYGFMCIPESWPAAGITAIFNAKEYGGSDIPKLTVTYTFE